MHRVSKIIALQSRETVSVTALIKRYFVLALLSLLATPSHARKLDEWIEIQTPHFIVVSNAGAKKAQQQAAQLEAIRRVFQQSLAVADTSSTPTLTVLLSKDEKSMRELVPEFWSKGHAHPAGLFANRMNQFYALIQADANVTDSSKVLYHEYYHLLTTPYFPDLPVWLSEGLADYFGNTEIENDRVIMGQVDQQVLSLLKNDSLIPLPVLLKADRSSPYYNEQNKVSMFYAESWALTHYFMIGDSMRHKPMLISYLEALNQGKTHEEAAAAFGDLKDLQYNLKKYVQGQSLFQFVIPLPNAKEPPFAVVPLTDGEVDAYLGGFAAIRGQNERALQLLEESIRLEPNFALAYQNLGLLNIFQDDPVQALENVSKAIALDAKNSWTHYFRAYVTTNGGSWNSPDAQVDQDLRDSIALNPDFPPPYGLLAVRLTMQKAPHSSEALTLANKAVALEPGDSTSQLELAEVLNSLGRHAEAKIVALRAKAQANNRVERSRADTFLTFLQHLEVDKEPSAVSGADESDSNQQPNP